MRVYDMNRWGMSMTDTKKALELEFLEWGEPVKVGEWQSQKHVPPEIATMIELRDTSLVWKVPGGMEVLQEEVKPNLPWAEEHFQERVSGEPWNPPPSHVRWPFRRKDNDEHMSDGTFSHTYPERFWPKRAGDDEMGCCGDPGGCERANPHVGIRFRYGDLGDVIAQLSKSPFTRQAYLPVWFPEDTGAVHGERVPCTLGYLFNIRNNHLHIVYYIRSCDFMRHFSDDVYMACRLLQWMVEQLDTGVRTGNLTMHINSFHIFQGDILLLRMRNPTEA